MPAVTAVLVRALGPSRSYSAGRVWKLTRTSRGSKPSWKPVSWLEAVPTAAEFLAVVGDSSHLM